MAVLKQTGPDPFAGKTLTSRGYRDNSERRLCYECGEYKRDDLFAVSANGKPICSDCASPRNRRALLGVACRADCEDGVCTCPDREPEFLRAGEDDRG